MTASTLQQRRLLYSGDVQGVGFRYTTRRIAREFDVVGYVRNLADRRVELVVEGAPEQVDQFVAAVGNRMSCQIHSIDSDSRPAVGEFATFDIRY